MEDGKHSVALVTGGSRGVGAAAVTALAARGCDVAFLFRNKATRAAQVARDVETLGRSALPLACDITDQEQRVRMLAAVTTWRPQIDLLILNASGGLERDLLAADPLYPLHINRDAQVAMLEDTLPLLVWGSTVVFVTSHWAHLYGRVAQIAAYEPIASSKHAGEVALREQLPRLANCGVRLLVVTGDLIEGTITPKLLERSTPGFTQGWRDQKGALPTAEEFCASIATAALDRDLESGHVIVVGNPLEALATLEQHQ
jgi:NAD(P)-dependent dehydrogenase (short-subunit alcohol dehydrogenase family)